MCCIFAYGRYGPLRGDKRRWRGPRGMGVLSAIALYFHERTIRSVCEELTWLVDNVGEFVALVELTAADRLDFPELDPESAFMLVRERGDGAVTVSELTDEEARDLRRNYVGA
jgi:hypothetical protein